MASIQAKMACDIRAPAIQFADQCGCLPPCMLSQALVHLLSKGSLGSLHAAYAAGMHGGRKSLGIHRSCLHQLLELIEYIVIFVGRPGIENLCCV